MHVCTIAFVLMNVPAQVIACLRVHTFQVNFCAQQRDRKGCPPACEYAYIYIHTYVHTCIHFYLHIYLLARPNRHHDHARGSCPARKTQTQSPLPIATHRRRSASSKWQGKTTFGFCVNSTAGTKGEWSAKRKRRKFSKFSKVHT